MTDDDKPIFYIGPRGVEINAGEGSKVHTNGTNITMKGIKQNSSGGEIRHKADNRLEQIGNTMDVSEDGEIINDAGGGHLSQIGNKMSASRGGKIINKTNKKWPIIMVSLAILGAVSDVVSLMIGGKHIWEWFF